MTTQTQPHVHKPWVPSRTALATRSLTAAMRLREAGKEDEYREAIRKHWAEFAPPIRRAACPLHRPA